MLEGVDRQEIKEVICNFLACAALLTDGTVVTGDVAVMLSENLRSCWKIFFRGFSQRSAAVLRFQFQSLIVGVEIPREFPGEFLNESPNFMKQRVTQCASLTVRRTVAHTRCG